MLRRHTLTYCLLLTFNAFAVNPPFLEPNQRAQALLKTLTLREKIGQLFMVAAASNFEQPTESLATAMRKCPYNIDPDHIKKLVREYHIGGLIFLFKSDPKTQLEHIDMYQKEAKNPLLIGQDSEWGISMRLDYDPKKVVRYPRAMTLGALSEDNEHLIYDMGKEIGAQCAHVGVHMNFAPVTDVNNNPSNPVIHDRSFGDNPQKVARLAALYARGLQDAGIIACAKHFPGHGDTNIDSHLDLPVINHTRNRLNDIELPPFQALINAGVGAVMNAHLAIPALDATPNLPSSMSYNVVTKLLKEDMGFQGLVITDGLGMEAITKHYAPGDLEYQAFMAGNDILLYPLDVPRAVALIEQAIREGTVTEEELDRRVLKILKAKEWAFKKRQEHNFDNPDAYLVRQDAIQLQCTLYRNAITVAHNTLETPFSPSLLQESCILQIGGALNQQYKEHAAAFCHVTSAISQQEQAQCLNAAAQKQTVILVMHGMNKSAQEDFGISPNTHALITALHEQGKKVVVVIIGTPYSIPHFKSADAVIVTYEDVPVVHQATLDVLRGVLDPQGVLPISL